MNGLIVVLLSVPFTFFYGWGEIIDGLITIFCLSCSHQLKGWVGRVRS